MIETDGCIQQKQLNYAVMQAEKEEEEDEEVFLYWRGWLRVFCPHLFWLFTAVQRDFYVFTVLHYFRSLSRDADGTGSGVKCLGR